MKRCLAIFAVMSVCSVTVHAVGPFTIEQLVAMALENNTDLDRARRSVDAARDALLFPSELVRSRVSVYTTFYPSSAVLSSAFAASTSFSVPVLMQLRVGGEITSSPSARGWLQYNPFEPGRAIYSQRNYLLSAEARLAYQREQLKSTVARAALWVHETQARRSACAALARVLSQRHSVAYESFRSGDARFADVEALRRQLEEAQLDAGDAESEHAYAADYLSSLLGMPEETPALADIALDDLRQLITTGDAELAKHEGVLPVSLGMRLAQLNLSAGRERLAYTVYRPDISVSVGANYSPAAYSSPAFTGSGSLAFGFSPADVKTTERRDISRSISDSSREVEVQTLAARQEARRLRDVLSVARESLSVAQEALGEAESVLAIVGAGVADGTTSALDVEEAQVSVEAARARILGSAAEVVFAQTQLLLLYPRQ